MAPGYVLDFGDRANAIAIGDPAGEPRGTAPRATTLNTQ